MPRTPGLRCALACALATVPIAADAARLEEIVVTATRREQNLQEVPISIVAITGEGLETRGIDNLEEVSQGIPNVLVTGGGGGTGGTNFRMRGIPGVGTYIDGVWQISTQGMLTQEFVDLDRIEVLRGPQGTLFGRDSVGGAIRIFTKAPAEQFGARILLAQNGLCRDVEVAVVVEAVDDHGRDHADEGQRRQPPDVPDQCEAAGRRQPA